MVVIIDKESNKKMYYYNSETLRKLFQTEQKELTIEQEVLAELGNEEIYKYIKDDTLANQLFRLLCVKQEEIKRLREICYNN